MDKRKIKIFKGRPKKENKKSDPINPDYYTKGIEVTKFILSWNMNFCEGNIIKYIVRYKNKNGLEDLKKARKYLDLLIQNKT
tara:strand:- start:360 stop:605 length:246 start_codon:yes stop_codon:yes gene_type:complete